MILQVEKAAWEFADTEKLLAIGEQVLTPYGARPFASTSRE